MDEQEDILLPLRAQELEGSKFKQKILNMTDAEAFVYLNGIKLQYYMEGYSDCLSRGEL